MGQLGYHIRIRLVDDSVIAPTIEQRRILARTILELGQAHGLFAFGYPDTHVHMAASCSREKAGKLAHDVGASLKQRLKLSTGFHQYEPKAIADQPHLRNVLEYVLTQPRRHELNNDPRREGSNLPDLLELRLIGAYTVARVKELLPRVRRPKLLEWLGVESLRPVDAPIDRIIEATLAAGCLNDIRGSTPEKVALRTAIITITGDQLPAPAIQSMLGISRGTFYRLRTRPVDARLVKAIKLQLALGLKLGRRADIDGPIR